MTADLVHSQLKPPRTTRLLLAPLVCFKPLRNRSCLSSTYLLATLNMSHKAHQRFSTTDCAFVLIDHQVGSALTAQSVTPPHLTVILKQFVSLVFQLDC